ncbi:uncharacterized protein LOC127148928 [Cucumis melo]|uniref:Uncharacterized protein LOC127148928 n=1 Tax=Cucumis melo TaxID=3656 RepID=A0ABM3KNH2_CUCME|nr:uncharacterized protein LOC127148928 [Cucumis melo]
MTQSSEDAPEVTFSSPPIRQSSVPASSATHAPRVPTTTMLDMDSDDQDDVPLARLLKRTLIPDVSDKLPINPPRSIPTNVQLGSSARSPLSSPLPFTSIGAHESVPNDVPGDISIAPVASKEEFSTKRRNITTKTGRKKIPPNIPSVPIDGISFHHEESVQHWKFVVQRRIADELNVSDKHQSYMSIMHLIERVGLAKTILNVGPFYPQLIREFIVNFPDEFNDPSSPNYQTVHIRGFTFVISPTVINGFLGNVIDVDCSSSSPSTDVLASVLSGGTLSTWPVNGIHAVALSIKYVILHKIGIANWFPSSHAFSVSAALGTFCIKSVMIIRWIRGSHVPDIDHDVHPSRGPRIFDTSDWDESAEGFFVDRELAAHIVNALTAESYALTNSINMLSERRLEINAFIRNLKTFAPSTSRRESTTD